MLENKTKSTHILVVLASTVIVVAGLKLAAGILIPLLLASFIAILAIPFMHFMSRHRVPEAISVVVVLLVLIALVMAVASFIGGTVNAFYHDIPLYEQRFHSLTGQFVGWLNAHGFEVSNSAVRQLFNSGQIMSTATAILNSVRGMLTNTLLILLIIMFILLEASGFPNKLRRAFGEQTQMLSHFKGVSKGVQFYLMLKTIISLVTGLLVWFFLWLLDVPYASLWGVTAFILNYIPTVGSFVAAIPAILISLIMIDPFTAGLVAIVYVVVNTLLGSVLEPRLMGHSLGISPLVVFLSLVFWGWVWGPIGMILCVPLTMVVKIALETNPNSRWLAVLLDR
ncbi:MAG: AI-2E family transporter [Venatoribacter sp.]